MFENAIQIDPVGCGCTECLTGEYVPVDRATTDQVFAMIRGELSNATSELFTVTTTTVATIRGDNPLYTDSVHTEVRAEYSGRTWSERRES
jgi:hypothetical protein